MRSSLRHARLARVLVALTTMVLGTACTTGSPSSGMEATPSPVRGDTVLPGDPRVDGRRLAPGTVTLAMTLERTGQPTRAMGTSVDLLTSGALNNAPALIRVGTVQRGTATILDSTWSDPRTLAPKRHRSVQPNRRLILDWNGAAVTGRVEPASGAPVVKDSAFAVPSFDSSNWDLVIRALDLSVGVRRVFPVYDVDGGVQWYSATVADTTRVEGRSAWTVKANLGRAGTATMTIEQATRRLHAVDVPLGQATLRMAESAR